MTIFHHSLQTTHNPHRPSKNRPISHHALRLLPTPRIQPHTTHRPRVVACLITAIPYDAYTPFALCSGASHSLLRAVRQRRLAPQVRYQRARMCISAIRVALGEGRQRRTITRVDTQQDRLVTVRPQRSMVHVIPSAHIGSCPTCAIVL